MLDVNTLHAAIKQAFADQATKKDKPDQALDDLAGKIAAAVDNYVKGILITYTSGLTANGYPVIGKMNYTVS